MQFGRYFWDIQVELEYRILPARRHASAVYAMAYVRLFVSPSQVMR